MDTIISCVLMLFLSLILYFSGLYVNKFSNNGIVFGVRVPKEYERCEEIKILEKKYKKAYIMSILPCTILLNFIVFIIPKLYIFLIATFLLLVLVNIPVIIYWKKLSELKKEKKWGKLGKNVVVVDTSIRKPKNNEDIVGIKNKHFLLIIIVPIINIILTSIYYKNIPEKFPIHFNSSGVADGFASKSGLLGLINLMMLPLMEIIMILFFMTINKFAINGKVDINSGTLSEIKEQRKIFKVYNSFFLYSILIEIVILFSLIQFSIIYSWSSNTIKLISIISLIIILFTVIVITILGYKIGQGGKNIKINKLDEEIYRDDDKNWILGNLYYNRNDPSIFVEKRIGIGWDVNLGNPIGMFIMILPIILIIATIIYFFVKGI